MGNPQKGLIMPMRFKTLWCVCRKTFSSFVLMQTIYETKERNWYPSVTAEIKFCWPTLSNNCHDIVFNYLSQFFYKETEQNDILCCSFLSRTCGRSLLTISPYTQIAMPATKLLNIMKKTNKTIWKRINIHRKRNPISEQKKFRKMWF